MMNIIWAGVMIASLLYAMITGTLPQTVDAGIQAAGESMMSILSFAGILCMWSGIMKVAQNAGLMNTLSRLVRPIMKRLFRHVPQDSEAMGYINMNLACNILGLGNAATPSGMAAMCALKKLNGDQEEASFDMCLFMVLNTASLQLIPTTMIALRAAKGSSAPAQIVVPVWIVSLLSVLCGISAVWLLDYVKRRFYSRLTKRNVICHNSTKDY